MMDQKLICACGKLYTFHAFARTQQIMCPDCWKKQETKAQEEFKRVVDPYAASTVTDFK